MRLSILVLSIAAVTGACGSPDSPFDQQEPPSPIKDSALRAPIEDAAAASSLAEVKLQVDGLTVWLRKELKPDTSAPLPRWILRGRTAGDLAQARSYILGDGFGQSSLTGERSFAVALDAHELNSLLSGLRLFIDLVPQSSRVQPATVAIVLAPRWQMAKGDDSLVVAAAVRPVNVAGSLLYRADVVASGEGAIVARASNGSVLTITARGQRRWSVDVPFDLLESEARSRAGVLFTQQGQRRVSRRADLKLGVSEADLFRGDAETRHPEAYGCPAEVQECIDRLQWGDYDYGVCGDYRPVTRCQLPSALPELAVIEHEEVASILNAAATVRAQRRADDAVYANVYAVQGSTDDPPRDGQVTRAWQQAMGAAHGSQAEPLGPLDAAAQAELDAAGIGDIAAAASATYAAELPFVTRLRAVDGGGLAHVLLYYPTAARLVAIDGVFP